MKKLLADLAPGDVIILNGGHKILVRKIEWMTHSETVLVNGEIIFNKQDRVEVDL
jgi:preprotein translocase subunit YajC